MSRRVTRAPKNGALSLALSLALLVTACGSSVKKVEASKADDKRRHFRIECIELDECKKKASAACGTPYEVVSEWHNTIPESELPGLNEDSRVKDSRDWNRQTLPNRTGIESQDPMPLSAIVVACNG
jgi:hypothetical protein